MGIIQILLSGLSAGAFSLGYKIAGRRGYAPEPLLTAFSLVIGAVSLVMCLTAGNRLGDTTTFVLGAVMGVFMLSAIMLYFSVMRTARHNVSWTVIQFSVLIPFLFSIIVYGERPGFAALSGTGCIILSVLLFGTGRLRKSSKGITQKKPSDRTGARLRQGSASGVRIAVALTLSTILSGFSQTVAPVYRNMKPDGTLPPLMFAAGVSMTIIAVTWTLLKGKASGTVRLSETIPRSSSNRPELPASRRFFGLLSVAAYMGVLNMTAFGLLLIGLHTVPGTIAFPARNAVNILAVFLFSFLLFGERADRYELAGAGAAVVGIALVSSGV